MTTPESPAPQSAGLSEREKWERCATVLEVGFGGLYSAHDALLDHFEKQQEGDTELRDRILALADEKGATAARPAEHEGASPSDTSGWTREVAVAMWRQEHAAKLRILATLAERERELRDVGNALTRQALDVDALKKKLAAAERVVEAARELSERGSNYMAYHAAKFYENSIQPPVGITPFVNATRAALAAYDATTPAARKPE